VRLFWRYGIRDTGYGLRDELDAVVGVLVLVDAGVFLVAVVVQYSAQSPLLCRARRSMTASALRSPQRAPVRSVLSLMRWRQAPSMTPVAIARPACAGRSGSSGRSVRVAGPAEFRLAYGDSP